ncbi:MAG: sulfatase [Candidatus Aminicenantes bacterium]
MKKTKITRREFCRAGMASLVSTGLTLSFLSGCSGKKKTSPLSNGLPNVIIFLVDMLRPDHLGVYGYPKKTSWNIDRLARQGIVFDNAYAPSPWTYPSVVSLLTGLLPSSHGATRLKKKEMVISKPDIWLPKIFKDKGCTTVCFHTHPYLRKEVTNIYLGFDEYYDPSKEKRGEARFSDYMYLDTLYPACEHWLEKNYQKPFFIYIHIIDVHGPYNKIRVLEEDKEWLNKLIKEKYAFPRAKNGMFASTTLDPNPYKSLFYDGYISTVDKYIAALFNKLQTLGIGEKTLLILTSDHGEGFGEHNCWNHGRNVYEHQIRIPLIFCSHEIARQKSRRISGIVNTVGLIPTLLDMLGMNVNDYVDGKSFFPLILSDDNNWSYNSSSDGCLGIKIKDSPDAFLVDTQFKLITEKKNGAQYLFNLKEDPHEMHPLTLTGKISRQSKETLKYLISKRKNFLSKINRKKKTIKKLKENDLKDIKSLGYL